jgi:hypothetical protein
VNQIRTRDGAVATVRHCGGISQWNVPSGGRMGWVTGEDATEVAPPATTCITHCQAQNRVRGGAVVLGNPAPAPVPIAITPPCDLVVSVIGAPSGARGTMGGSCDPRAERGRRGCSLYQTSHW